MNHESHLGNIERHRGRTTLKFQRSLAHRPEKVWRALTESEHMRWWMPVDMVGERSTGATLMMIFWPDLVEKKGLNPDAGTALVSIWDPPQVFEWVWHGSRVRFDLAPTDKGCILGLSVDIETDDPDTIADNAGGFHLWMEHLSTLLKNGECPPIADAEPQGLEDHYRLLVETT